ncbi:hypothetical protein [Anaerotignum propionicum]|uniref:Uncharacterized protein n=1 Tax=Anaerotignum propionicum DSM 1682 TaxID=991789 RepID=A0A0X1U9E5_ANAPI|nr:hypothetical protein [Anaerotignum propionicum]AMJ41559.1 hypothetical protein CPRO_19770 [Anaerotignum propionicum DSM 1682]SHE71412.1 hypothetical protein SAMN02745151_01579 [[Clostridium] propionicum DSM 1682] [Anaerotignum propionicum DSM 1682]
MPRLFMYGTELQEMEQLMMLVPRFSPRQKGLIVVGETTDVQGGIKKCRSYEKCGKDNCGKTTCTNLTNSTGMGRVHYREMIIECFSEISHFYFRKRLSDLVASSTDDWFISEAHEGRFENVCEMLKIHKMDRNPRYLATLFLLTADGRLCSLVKEHIYSNRFEFKHIRLSSMTTQSYALYQVAKTIYTGKEYIKLNEIADKYLIDHQTFMAIIHAILIVKYGGEILSFKMS